MIDVTFIWYWFLIGVALLTFGSVLNLRSGKDARAPSLPSIVCHAAGIWFASYAVVQNLIFVTVFAAPFGITIALVNWAGIRYGAANASSRGTGANR